jgi:hypothetical protein
VEWKIITIDFITKPPRTVKKHDSIMLAVDKLTKDTHFIAAKPTHNATNIVYIYIWEIVMLHGVSNVIVFDRDPKFTSNFWKGLFKIFGINLNFSIAYHPDSDWKTERVNQVIEDMLRIYAMDNPSKWEDYLYLVEFAYNNEYHASLKMSTFEALYRRRCNTHISLDNPNDRSIIWPELLREWKNIW